MKVWIKHKKSYDIDIIIPYIKLPEISDKEIIKLRRMTKNTLIQEVSKISNFELNNLVFESITFNNKRIGRKSLIQIFNSGGTRFSIITNPKEVQYDYDQEIEINKSGVLDIIRRKQATLKTNEKLIEFRSYYDVKYPKPIPLQIQKEIIWIEIIIKNIEDNWT